MTAPIEPTNPSELFSPFLPATILVPNEPDRMRTFLLDKLSSMSDVINDKTIGAYTQVTENFGGEKWCYKTNYIIRNSYKTIAYIPSLPNTGTLTLTRATNPQYPLTNVNPQFVATRVYGTASKPCTATGSGNGSYFSFMPEGDSRISFTMSDTSIVITTTTNLSAYSCFIIVEYLRNGT
jgi:hypothetical protein